MPIVLQAAVCVPPPWCGLQRSCRQLCLPSARVGHGILLICAPWCAFFFVTSSCVHCASVLLCLCVGVCLTVCLCVVVVVCFRCLFFCAGVRATEHFDQTAGGERKRSIEEMREQEEMDEVCNIVWPYMAWILASCCLHRHLRNTRPVIRLHFFWSRLDRKLSSL